MNILHLGKYFPPYQGGIENFMAALMAQQTRAGHKVSAVVHHHETQQQYSLNRDNGSAIYRVPSFGQLAYAPMSPSFGYHLATEVAIEKPDVIHIHLPNLSAFWCLLLPSARKIPWVVHWHSDVVGAVPDLNIKLLYPIYRFFEQALLKRAKRIIATSPVYLASSKALKPFVNKAVVVPLGVDNKPELKRSENSTKTILNMLVIGRMTYYKGYKLLINAINHLKKKGVLINLSIVGDGELKDEIQQQVENLALTSQVFILGKLSENELNEQLAQTDLLCLPSIERTEAFGMVLLEAMRASVPCLVSDVPGSGMSWVVENDETGFVFKHGCETSLANKMQYIIENRHLLSTYGKAGRKRFEQLFTMDKIAQQIDTIYHAILGEDNIR